PARRLAWRSVSEVVNSWRRFGPRKPFANSNRGDSSVANPANNMRLYLQLADESQRLGRAEDRERFLLLAADTAFQAGQLDEAERIRRNILAHNPNYFLKPYSTLAEALKTPDILKYVQDLRKHYPPGQAEKWLQSLRGQAHAGGDNVDRAALATLQPQQAA